MRVAHAGGDRIACDGQEQQVDIFGQGNRLPVQYGRPHVHAGQAIASILGQQHSMVGPQAKGLFTGPVHQEAGDTARGIAARRDLAAIRVEDAHFDYRPR